MPVEDTHPSIQMSPIGYVRGGRVQPDKDDWGDNECLIVLRDDIFTAQSLAGMSALSHVEVLFYFHLHADEAVEFGARHPRNRLDWPLVGIFAQRGRMRHNRIGVSKCQVVKTDGLALQVRGLDAVDGTPVLDIKPVWSGNMPRGTFYEPEWAKQIMQHYWHRKSS